MNSHYKTDLLDLKNASDQAYYSLNKIINAVRYERQPGLIIASFYSVIPTTGFPQVKLLCNGCGQKED